MTNRIAAFSRSDRAFRTFPTFRLGNAAKSGASAPGFFRSLHEFKWFFRLTDDFLRRIFPQTQQIPVILRSRGFIWRRRRDLNSRADFSTYSLSRGAPSPAWVRLHVKLCSCRSISCPLFPQKNLAERVGFEPTRPFGQTVFKTASLWPLRYLSKLFKFVALSTVLC